MHTILHILFKTWVGVANPAGIYGTY